MQGVAKNFREIFAELAPGGRGELVMQKAPPRPQAPAGESEEAGEEGTAEAHRAYDRYSGVRVKVRCFSKPPLVSGLGGKAA